MYKSFVNILLLLVAINLSSDSFGERNKKSPEDGLNSKAQAYDLSFSEREILTREYSKAISEKDIEGAIGIADRLIAWAEVEPESTDPLWHERSQAFASRGVAKTMLSDYDGAIDDFYSSIKFSEPAKSNTLFHKELKLKMELLSTILFLERRYWESLNISGEALQLFPRMSVTENLVLYYTRGRSFNSLGKHSSAAYEFSNALRSFDFDFSSSSEEQITSTFERIGGGSIESIKARLKLNRVAAKFEGSATSFHYEELADALESYSSVSTEDSTIKNSHLIYGYKLLMSVDPFGDNYDKLRKILRDVSEEDRPHGNYITALIELARLADLRGYPHVASQDLQEVSFLLDKVDTDKTNKQALTLLYLSQKALSITKKKNNWKELVSDEDNKDLPEKFMESLMKFKGAMNSDLADQTKQKGISVHLILLVMRNWLELIDRLNDLGRNIDIPELDIPIPSKTNPLYTQVMKQYQFMVGERELSDGNIKAARKSFAQAIDLDIFGPVRMIDLRLLIHLSDLDDGQSRILGMVSGNTTGKLVDYAESLILRHRLDDDAARNKLVLLTRDAFENFILSKWDAEQKSSYDYQVVSSRGEPYRDEFGRFQTVNELDYASSSAFVSAQLATQSVADVSAQRAIQRFSSKDDQVRDAMRTLQDLNQKILKMQLIPSLSLSQQKLLKKLEEQKENGEKILRSLVPEYFDFRYLDKISEAKVASVLSKDEAFIKFLRIESHR